jgi:hypothetical protein
MGKDLYLEKNYRILEADKFGADKGRIYLRNYEEYFQDYAEKHVNLLELGVNRGGSLLLWQDYFAKGNIVGLDLNPCKLEGASDRIHIYQGSQTDLRLLDKIRNETAPSGFDIIIDDASHLGELTKISFWHLFDNHLKAGGLYVIEDWRTGYWSSYGDGAPYVTPSGGKSLIERLYNSSRRSLLLNRIIRNVLRVLFRYSGGAIFPSHHFGMVGVVKQLVDELGMDAIGVCELGKSSITELLANKPCAPRFPKFRDMKFTPGQVFITKATDGDNALIAEMLRNYCDNYA